MTGYTVEASAVDDLENIYAYTVAKWGAIQAAAYTSELVATFQGIADRSVISRRIPTGRGVDGYFCRCRRHLIYWRLRSDNHIAIIAILHERMDQRGRLSQILRKDS